MFRGKRQRAPALYAMVAKRDTLATFGFAAIGNRGGAGLATPRRRQRSPGNSCRRASEQARLRSSGRAGKQLAGAVTVATGTFSRDASALGIFRRRGWVFDGIAPVALTVIHARYVLERHE